MTKEVVTKESLFASKTVYFHHTLPSDGGFVKHTLKQVESKENGNFILFWYG